jgi:tetratricopeptide (TPR) repeat protein
MNDRHLDRTALERYLGDTLSDRESRDLQRHLFICPDCEERLLALLPGSAPSPHPLPRTDDHRGLIRRLLDDHRSEIGAHRGRLAAERTTAFALWREIEPLSHERRRTLVWEDARFQSWGFHEFLLDHARLEALEAPHRGEDLLRLALDVAERLDGEEYGPGSVEAAKVRTWAYLGNAFRVLGDFRQAESAFQTAEMFLSRSWLDPLDEALILELKAPLRRAQRRFDEALDLLADAIAIYREVNEPHLQGRALMTRGLALQYKGDYEAAADCFRASLYLLDGLREPRLVGMSQFNLIGCLQDAGRSMEAAALIPDARRIMAQVGTRSDQRRLRWTEGKVAASLGRYGEAEDAFRELRRIFVEDGIAFEAALVSLELATLYMRQRRIEETKRLAAEILPIFQSREVYREALAALIVFQQAAEMEQLTVGLVEEIAAYLDGALERSRSAVARQSGLREGGPKDAPGAFAGPIDLQKGQPPLRSLEFLESLIQGSLETSIQDPSRGEDLGQLALQVTNLLEAAHHGSERLEDLRARAWAHVGNARRIKSDLQGSEEAFQQAQLHMERGTGDRLELAILWDLKASLKRSQRLFDESCRLLEEAISAFLELGDRHRAGRSLVNLSLALNYSGAPEGSISPLYRALDLIDPEQEPRLLLTARHNLILVLAETGRFFEAQRAYREARLLYRSFPDTWTQNRRKWVKGKIAYGFGQLRRAELLFLSARDGFLAEGVPYDTALVSLEIALLYARQGRTAELTRLAAEMVPIFASRQIHREALAAVAFFQQAVEAERASVEVVERVAEFLRRARHSPEFQFQELPS